MIYDCFSFFNELDVLEIRLNTLNEVVDKFVLVEAPWTHTGKPKPLYFEENKKRFAPFLDKIIHVVISDADLPPFPSNATERDKAWIRENVQRNAISKGLADARPDDIIIISDLDEIPDPKKIKSAAAKPRGITNFKLRNYAYFLNLRNLEIPMWGLGPKLLTLDCFQNPATYADFKHSEYASDCANPIPSATIIRMKTPSTNLNDAGWHFSYMGGSQKVKEKLQSYAHTEYSQTDPESFSGTFLAESIDDAFPPFLQAHQQRYSSMLLPPATGSRIAMALHCILARLKRLLHDNAIAFLIHIVPKSLYPFFRKIRRVLST